MATLKAPFRLGKKQLYLPSFTVSLLRTPSLPSTQARFAVPLWFSKLDLRDYLYNVYSVRTGSIRSTIKQSRVALTSDSPPESGVSRRRRWHRPRGQKHMTVELERGFVWPDVPSELDAWGPEEVSKAEKEQERFVQRVMGTARDAIGVAEEERREMREQARGLVEGRRAWVGGGAGSGGEVWRGLARGQ